MKRLTLVFLFGFSLFTGFGQGSDDRLEGRWELFKIIDNMTGDEIPPAHKTTEAYTYWISFTGNIVKYNLEVNKCDNEFTVNKDREIEFKYFSECTKICCDDEFSALLTYPDCTKYYIKDGEVKTLVMVSEDRIFYFKSANITE